MACVPSLYIHQPIGLHYADETRQVASLAGINVIDWQYEALKGISAHKTDGQFVHRRVGLSIPRQAGKSVDGIVWVIFLLVILGYKVLWTDHNYATTMEMLRRFQDIFGKKTDDPLAKYPFFNDLLERVSNKTAQEAFFFKNGGLLAFSTRTKSAALGFSFDVVIYDEAQELTTEHVQAITPTTTSGEHHNTQFIYLGTPTRAGSAATCFSDMHEEAHNDPQDDLLWLEYGVSEVGDVYDENRWEETNPSIEEGVADLNAIRAGIRSFGSDHLAAAQEYLGYWLPLKANALVSKKEWAKTQIEPEQAPLEGKIAYGVKFSPDGSEVALAVALKAKNKPVHVEVVEVKPLCAGTTWLAVWLISRSRVGSCVVIDGKSGTGNLIEKLAKDAPKKYLVVPKTADVITAAAMTLEAIQTEEITHIEQPALDISVTKSIRRRIGSDGWGWGGDMSTPIEAVSLAIWGVMTSKRNPQRKQEASF